VSYSTMSYASTRIAGSRYSLAWFTRLALIGACSFAALPLRASTLWTASASPATRANSDPSAYELGVKFESDVSGHIVAIRFFKGHGNTGRHVGHLWTASGKLLSTAIFTHETATGWQQVSLPAPVAIRAHTVYVASYWDPRGHHAISYLYFRTAHTSLPLRGLASGADGGNGVFRRRTTGFPTRAYRAANYWVDVVFIASETALLSGRPLSLSFGDVTVGTKSTLPFVITNTGSKRIAISRASVRGTGFSVKGSHLPSILRVGQDVSFSVSFDPRKTGRFEGSVMVVSSATNSPTKALLFGTGVGRQHHTVTLTWLPSTSPHIVGYNVYRAHVSSGPYTRLNSSLVGITAFTDFNVEGGESYYYVTTAVDSLGIQSRYSNRAEAVVP
jgi:hypothetical protein